MEQILQYCAKYKKIYCYGAGRYGRELCVFLRQHNIEIAGFIVSVAGNEKRILKKPVYVIDEITVDKETGIIITVSSKYREAIAERLTFYGIEGGLFFQEEWLEKIEQQTDYNVRENNRVAVLLYHRVLEDVHENTWGIAVSKNNFEQQIKYISQHYQVLNYGDNWDGVSKPSVVITFDDGYVDNFINALPILQKYNVPAIIFISTGNIGTECLFWWDRLERVFANVSEKGSIFVKGQFVSNVKTAHSMLIKMPVFERNEVLTEMEKRYRINFHSVEEDRTVSVEELKELAASDLITIGAHTVSHVSLSDIPKDEQLYEIKESVRFLENNTGKEIKYFSYPFGNYNDETLTIMRQEGITRVSTVVAGLVDDADSTAIPRNVVHNIGIKDFVKFIKRIFFVYGEV